MPTVDVVDLNNQKVGELELADEVFGAPVNEALLYEAVRQYQAGVRARHAQDQDSPRSGRIGQEAVEAEGHRPGAYGFGPVAALASRRHGARTAAARLQLQAAPQDAAGRAALGALGEAARRRVEGRAGVQSRRPQDQERAWARWQRWKPARTVLVVDNGENRNLALGLRNLKGVTLLPTREVNPYHLLGHQSVLLSAKPRRASSRRRSQNEPSIEVIRRPLVTEKGVDKKDNERTLCFEVRAGRQQDAGQGRGGEAVQGESGRSPHRDVRRQAAAPRPVRRLPLGLEEGLREAEGGREGARVRGDLRGIACRSRHIRPTTPTRRFQTVVSREDITKDTPEKSLVEAQEAHRRPQQHGPRDLAVHRRRRTSRPTA